METIKKGEAPTLKGVTVVGKIKLPEQKQVSKQKEKPVAPEPTPVEKVYSNEAERKAYQLTAKMLGFKPQMPVCKNPHRPECYAGYMKRFDNWVNNLLTFAREKSYFLNGRKQKEKALLTS